MATFLQRPPLYNGHLFLSRWTVHTFTFILTSLQRPPLHNGNKHHFKMKVSSPPKENRCHITPLPPGSSHLSTMVTSSRPIARSFVLLVTVYRMDHLNKISFSIYASSLVLNSWMSHRSIIGGHWRRTRRTPLPYGPVNVDVIERFDCMYCKLCIICI